jgi:hypothetical protein
VLKPSTYYDDNQVNLITWVNILRIKLIIWVIVLTMKLIIRVIALTMKLIIRVITLTMKLKLIINDSIFFSKKMILIIKGYEKENNN